MRQTRSGLAVWMLAGLAAVAGGGAAMPRAALAQNEPVANPVYLDEWAAASDALAGVGGQVASGNLEGAVRVLQKLLDEEPAAVVATERDADLFVSVRDRVNALLLATPALLARYREVEGPKALHAMEDPSAGPERVEQSWLLTPAGMEAALRVAQTQLEGARFNAAWLTLRQLDAHPDRTGKAGADAAALLSSVARYLDRAEVQELASRWSRQAGAGGVAGQPAEWPAGALRRGASPLDAVGPVSLDGIVAKALWSVPLPNVLPASQDPVAFKSGFGTGAAGTSGAARSGQTLGVLPTFDGESVYVNDGTAVTAWDRFTLTKRWSVSPVVESRAEAEAALGLGRRGLRPTVRRGGMNILEDAATVAAAGRDVIAVTGLPIEGRREGEGVHDLDAQTGRVRWSVEPADLDPALAQTSVRGPVLVSEGTVVLAMRKSSLAQRLASLYLVGLDQATGQLKWRRMVGSAGSLPYGRSVTMIDGGVLADGVVYRADQLGVIGAYEAQTGRPLWVRRCDSLLTYAGSDAPHPWQISLPVLDGGSMIVLSPDRRSVLRLDRATGRLLGSRAASEFSSPAPDYLVRAGDTLAGVGAGRVSLAPIATFDGGGGGEPAPIRQVKLTDPGIRGRVIAAGTRLLLPTGSGVAVLDTADAAPRLESVALEHAGNILALPSQILVIDDQRLHSYLLWDEAERVLTERMHKDPADPAPAATFAEVAYRAGHFGKILSAVDTAVVALDAGAAADRPAGDLEPTRRHLFESLLGMINASQEPGVAGAGAPAPAAAGGPPPAAASRIADAQLLGSLIERLGRLASTADQRVSQLLAQGRFDEGRGQSGAGAAVETYQRILDDPALSGATWTGPQVSLRGELEATWRLERLVQEQGPTVYAVHESQARNKLAALGAAPSPEALEGVARRYPIASITAATWLKIAELHAARSHTQAAATALEAGLRAASRRSDSDGVVMGQLAGRLVRALEERGQYEAAAQVLRQMREQHPGVALADAGGAIDADALLGELGRRVSAASRWPRIGSLTAESVQTMPGWVLLRPMLRDTSGSVARCLVMEDGEQVGVWACRSAAEDDCAGELARTWSIPTDGQIVDLIRAEGDDAYLFVSTAAGGSVLKVSASKGQTVWRSAPFPSLFGREGQGKDAAAPDTQPAPVVQTPLDGLVPLTDLMPRMDGRTVVLVERSGRAAAFDSQSGQLLWTLRTPVTRVYDVEMRGGVLAIGGEQEAGAEPGAAGPSPLIIALDDRTGQIVQRITPASGQVRWVAMDDQGAVIAGLDEGLASYDVARGHTKWAISDEMGVARSSQAWLVGERLFVMCSDGPVHTMRAVSARDGRLGPQPVRIPPERFDDGMPVYAACVRGPAGAQGPAALALSTIRGLVVVSGAGELLGVDALGGEAALLAPQPGEGVMVAVETVASSRERDGQMAFSIHLLDSSSARILQSRAVVLGARPRRLALVDGRIAVTAGGSTVVLRAPAGPK